MLGYNTTCDIWKFSTSTNQYGEEIRDWRLSQAGVLCRFVTGDQKHREYMAAVGGARAKVASHLVILPITADVEIGDKLVKGQREYEVLVCEDIDGAGIHKEAYVVRLEGKDA